eukprot:gene16845-23076_t
MSSEDIFVTSQLFLVPNIVHQTYDYPSPNFFFYLSLLCVKQYIKPEKHILWVNDEGKYRKNQFEHWQTKAKNNINSWEYNLTIMIQSKQIEVIMHTFPFHPPYNNSIFAPNKAHRSDFVRMIALYEQGGIYLDTDAFAFNDMKELRVHNFTLSFDNIVNLDDKAPKRLNNGVILSSPSSLFLKLWMKEYNHFNPNSFDYDSSVVPYRLATQYPDLIHIEMNRLSPISYGFQTSTLAESLTCGILCFNDHSVPYAIHHPVWDYKLNGYTYHNTTPDKYMFDELKKKYVFHLTMSQV